MAVVHSWLLARVIINDIMSGARGSKTSTRGGCGARHCHDVIGCGVDQSALVKKIFHFARILLKIVTELTNRSTRE